MTRRAVEMCHLAGVSVEAELGHVGHSGEKLSEADSQARLTRVDEAVRYVAETGVDALAVAVGTIHGLYRGKPVIDFDRLRALREALDIPLVLHGGSDTPDEDIQRAIATGVDKINIWTDVRVAYLRAVRDFLATTTLEGYAFEQLMAAARQSVCAAARQKMRVFGSAGKADGFRPPAAALNRLVGQVANLPYVFIRRGAEPGMENCLAYHRGGRRVVKRLPPEFLYNKQGFNHRDTKTRRCTKESVVFVNLVTLCRCG